MPAYEFNLNVDPGGMPPVIHLAQYDTGRTYYANLKQGGEYYYLGLGATAKIKGRNARGVCWELDCTVNTSLTYQVQFTPEGAATDQFGIMPVQMELTAGGEVISTLLMVWDIQRAGYTSEEAVTSPEFETALEEAVAAAIAQQGLGFTEEFKQALLACFNNVAWATPDGQSLVDDLENALYPEVHLTSITANYLQDRPILDTDSLDLVRLDLVVTATYSDGTSETLADDAYTLTGTLVAPSSTITVTYQGKTATITVTVTHNPVPAEYQRVEWVGNTNRSWIRPSGKKLPTAFRIEAKTKLDGYRTSASYGNIAAAFQLGANTYGMEFAYKKEDDTVVMFMGAQSVLTPSDVNGVLTLGAVCTGTTVKAYELVDGVRNYGTEQTVSRDYTSSDYGIFYAGESQTSYNQFVGRVYYFELYDSSDNLIAQYLPCYRKSDNVIGFYETVDGTFYTNVGGDTFTKGGDI